MQRLLTSLTLVGLLVATAATFAITERLKLTKSAISGTRVSRSFSPSCGCTRKRANVRIVLRRADTLENAPEQRVRTPLRLIVRVRTMSGC